MVEFPYIKEELVWHTGSSSLHVAILPGSPSSLRLQCGTPWSTDSGIWWCICGWDNTTDTKQELFGHLLLPECLYKCINGRYIKYNVSVMVNVSAVQMFSHSLAVRIVLIFFGQSCQNFLYHVMIICIMSRETYLVITISYVAFFIS